MQDFNQASREPRFGHGTNYPFSCNREDHDVDELT